MRKHAHKRRIVGQVLMDIGVFRHTVAADIERRRYMGKDPIVIAVAGHVLDEGKNLAAIESEIDKDLKPQSALLAGWNITNPPILTNADVEQRKIYNTRMFSQGNGGHDFTAVLTDAERRALIEYLKTL